MSFSEPVLMTGLINITQEISAAGAALKKSSGGDGYNATATSLEYIDSLQSPCRGVKWTVPDAWGSFRLGLASTTGFPQNPQQEAKVRESCDISSISHAARINSSGDFDVYEGGKHMGMFGKVKAGHVIEVRLSAEPIPKIQYRISGKLVYTSTKDTPLQLCAKVCAYSPGPLVEGLQWIFEPAPCTKGEVTLTGFRGIFPHSNGISKMQYLSCTAFNAAVHSKDAIKDIGSEHVGSSFVISQSESGCDQNFAVGFTSDPDQGPSLKCLAHAIHIQGSSLKFYAQGVVQGEIHHHVKAGDTIDMMLALDEESSQPKIQYYANRQLLAETHSEVHFPLYVKVCARSPGKLIEDLRWIDRSQLKAPCLRHVATPASTLTDDTAVRMRQLEMTVSKLVAEDEAARAAEKASMEAKLEEMKAVSSELKKEVDSLKQILKTAEEQAQLREEARVEKEHLEVQLKEMKAELAEAKEALSAATKDKEEAQPCSRPATLRKSDTNDLEDTLEEAAGDGDGQQTQRHARESPELQQLKLADLLAHMSEKLKQEVEMQMRRVVKEVHQQVRSLPPFAVAPSASVSKEGFLEEDFLAAMLERAQLRRQNAASRAVGEQSLKVRPEMQQPQQEADSEKMLAIEADKAHLQMQNQQLQKRCAQLEELERRIDQAGRILHTSHFPQKSEADSSEWEPLGSDLPASGPAV